MKRSEINKALKELEKMIADHQYYLPKFANFTPEEWKTKGHEFDEIRDNMLGWDIPTTAWEILINMDFPCLLFVMEILK